MTQSGVESIFEQAIIQHYHMDVLVEITSIDTCDIERDRVVIVQHVLHFFPCVVNKILQNNRKEKLLVA